jgi:high affinity Mn2+ porin
MTYAAWDFASDARGYSYGGVAELDWDDWAVRVARITPPKNPNQLAIDFRLLKYYGDQMELEHKHKIHGQEGAVRVLAYRNHEDIGKFSDAIAVWEADPAKNATTCPGFNYGSDNANAPDLCWARKPNVKVGIGMFAQQYLTEDIGLFSRAMYSDGKTEVDAYTSTDRSATFGLLAKGTKWSRPRGVTGVGSTWVGSLRFMRNTRRLAAWMVLSGTEPLRQPWKAAWIFLQRECSKAALVHGRFPAHRKSGLQRRPRTRQRS